MSVEIARQLGGTVDGVNRDFTTPTSFLSGSLRLIRNGIFYDPSDDVFGWTETGANSIRLTEAPEAGESLQAFYTELKSQGGPTDPDGVLP